MKEIFQTYKLVWKKNSFVALFVAGLVVGMLHIVFNQSELLLQSDVLSESTLSLVKMKESNSNSLFLWVVKERMWVIPLLFLISTTNLSVWMVYGMTIWYGVSFGTLFAVAILRYKILGVLFLLLCSMPQYLFYGVAFVTAIRLCKDQRKPDVKFWGQFAVLEIIVLIGCLSESYINYWVIEKIIKFFIGV